MATLYKVTEDGETLSVHTNDTAAVAAVEARDRYYTSAGYRGGLLDIEHADTDD